MKQLTAEEIREKISNKETFFLDMYATWCGPCKVLMGNMQKLADSGQELQMEMFKYDVDSDPELTSQMGIRSVPTVKIFKDGEVVKTNSGVLTQQQIIELMEQY
jgi:thioredoxin 1